MNRRIECPIHKHADRSPGSSALLSEKCNLSYEQLNRYINDLQGNIKRLSLNVEKRIALAVNDSASLIALLFAFWREGITTAILSTRLPDESVIDQCRFSGCSTLIHDSRPGISGAGINIIKMSELSITGDETKHPIKGFYDPGQPCTIIFTSGSTGRPKAVLHSFANHYYSALGSNEHIAVGGGDRWLLALPLYHVGGIAILFRCFLAGAAVAVKSAGSDICEDILDYKVTHLSLVPTQLHRLIDNCRDLPVRRLKAVLIGGSGIAGALVEKAVKKRFPVYLSYGSTEMSSQIVTTDKVSSVQKRRSVVLPYRELKIDLSGEICVKGKVLFEGYVDGDHIIRTVDDEGWFHSGDLGRFTEQGLEVTGRMDSMFISGGENIHPEEIERHLVSLREVDEAVVIGVADREFGKRPVAFLRFDSGMRLSDKELRRSLGRKLPRFKIPDAFYLWLETVGPARMKAGRSAIEKEFSRRPLSFTKID